MRPSRTTSIRTVTYLATFGLLGALLAACGSSGTTAQSATSDSSGSAAVTTSSAPTKPATAQTINLALDWTPNVNHTGFFVAKSKDYYADAGIKINFLPYAQAAADTLVAAGKANCGITDPITLATSINSGAKEIAVMGIIQQGLAALMVKADTGITSPKGLDGKKYGGFGTPGDKAQIASIIKAAGGTGNFDYISLQAGAFDALVSGKVDFMSTYLNVEPIEAKDQGVKVNVFPFSDYGVPQTASVMLACNTDWLAKNGDLAKRFIEASAKGWQFALDQPDAAVGILVADNPSSFVGADAKKVPAEGLAVMIKDHLIVPPGGHPGCLDVAAMGKYYDHYDKIGYFKALKMPAPDMSKLATTKYLPSDCSS